MAHGKLKSTYLLKAVLAPEKPLQGAFMLGVVLDRPIHNGNTQFWIKLEPTDVVPASATVTFNTTLFQLVAHQRHKKVYYQALKVTTNGMPGRTKLRIKATLQDKSTGSYIDVDDDQTGIIFV